MLVLIGSDCYILNESDASQQLGPATGLPTPGALAIVEARGRRVVLHGGTRVR